MEWVKIENRSQNGLSHYYLVNENDALVITKNNEGDEITCRLQDGSEKKLKLFPKSFEVIGYDHSGTKIVSTTKKWFVKDGENEYMLDEIEISKDDIMVYKS